MNIDQILDLQRRVPSRETSPRVVLWHVFRARDEAREFAGHVVLGAGQRLVGGRDTDSVGILWWLGVEVEDVARWGNRAAINKHAD